MKNNRVNLRSHMQTIKDVNLGRGALILPYVAFLAIVQSFKSVLLPVSLTASVMSVLYNVGTLCILSTVKGVQAKSSQGNNQAALEKSPLRQRTIHNLKGQSNEIFSLQFFFPNSCLSWPLRSGLKYFQLWQIFCRVIQISRGILLR